MNSLLPALRSKFPCSPKRTALALLAALVATNGSVQSEAVDTELLLLIDTSISVSDGDLIAILDGYAQAFESSAVIDMLQSGDEGRIAVSVVFFSGIASQAVAVPWTSISDVATASAFAVALRAAALPRLYNDAFTSIAEGINYATAQFGDETGFAPNGFESDSQAINMTTTTFLWPAEGPAAVQAASAAALGAGVDVINGMTIGTFNLAGSTNYYNDNIVGGSYGGDPAEMHNSPDYGTLPAVATTTLGTQIFNLVPEPGTAALALLGLSGLCLRRRRA